MKYKLCLLLALVIVSGCADDFQSNIPNVKFSITLSLLNPYKDTHTGKLVSLSMPDTYLTLDRIDARFPTPSSYGLGYQGLIIYHSSFDEFYCFDRACPNCANYGYPQTSIPNDNYQVTCPQCKQIYSLFNYGAPKNGKKGDQGLKIYKSYDVIRNSLRIAN